METVRRIFSFPRISSTVVFLCYWSLVTGHWSLTLAQPPAEVTSLRGKVVERRGEPVARAQVILRRVSKPHQATALWGAQALTNEKGEFVFAEVEEGFYTATVIAKDFAELTSGLLEVKGAKPVMLPPLTLATQPHVSGRVFDVRGGVLADATLGVTVQWEQIVKKRREMKISEQQIQTDAQGKYSLTLRGPGTGAFFVRAEGKGWASSPPLKADEDETIGGVDLALRRGGDVLVLLQSKETGEPVTNAAVSVQFRPSAVPRLPFRPVLSGRTGSDGKCRFSEVPTGYWNVTAYPVDAPLGNVRTQMAYVGAEQTAGVLLEVFGGAALNVQVYGPDFQTPIPDASVRLDYADALHPNETRVTDSGGVCSFSNVAAGEHKVSVRAQGFATTTRAFRLGENLRQARIHVVLRAATGSIAGRVRDADGKPVPRAFVSAVALPPGGQFTIPSWAWADDGWREWFAQRLDLYSDEAVVEADSTGAFVIPALAPGRYLLFSPMIHPPDAVSPIVVVEEGKTVKNVSVTVDASCRAHVSGRVVRADGSPLRSGIVQMTVRHNDGQYLLTVRFILSTDEQGRYYFMRRGPGTYFIEASVEGEGSVKLWREVGGDEEIGNLDLRLKR